MKYEMYVIYDRKSGIYSMPQCYYNEATAKRAFNYSCSITPDKNQAQDMELYFVGEYDSSSAQVRVGEKPVFVCSYVEAVMNNG